MQGGSDREATMMAPVSEAAFSLHEAADGRRTLVLSGDWTLARLPASIAAFEASLRAQVGAETAWDLHGITRLDSVGALTLWRAWGGKWPKAVAVPPVLRAIIERAAAVPADNAQPERPAYLSGGLLLVGGAVLSGLRNLAGLIALFGQLVLDARYLLFHPRDIPGREFSANIFRSGAQALPVTALVGFLIGVVLSFLSALQLRTFGADIYIVNLLGISIIRELGPVLVAVLVAGRSGSAMTAQIGVMRVTQEIDALATMGVSRSLRLVFPKVAALALTMPLLVVWCSAAALVGGMVSANLEMGLSFHYFITALPRVVPVANVWIGLSKGVFFGFLIALVSCHFGLKVRPNTESLSSNTTTAVVTAITLVILTDALFAILTRNVGI